MEVSFLTGTLSFLVLLFISSFIFIFSRRFNLPYTIMLVIVGLLLVPLSHIEFFSFINHFKLTPEVLFFIFLPTLLFEASYKIDYKKIVKDWRAIGMLSIVGVSLSAVIIAGLLYFLFPLLGFHIPFLVILLFGVIISATDPVAVLSIFQSIGAPRRLALLFEGESLFNDGTAVALFFVILGIIMLGGTVDFNIIVGGFSSFASMMIGGALFGGAIGVIFAKIVGRIKNAESVEIMLTMILAHITFLLAEAITHYLHNGLHIEYLGVSGVIATVVAGIVMGNYGKYKITAKVEKHVEQMWEFFAFVSNSIVFLLIGLIVSELSINLIDFILPIIVVIIVVSIARAISVYLPIGILNKLKLGEKIPLNWQHILSWGSLRGSLALMMVLLIPGEGQNGFEKIQAFQEIVNWPYDYSIKDFLLVIVIGAIMFTLLIKATTIPWLMRKTNVSKLHEFEKFEYFEGNTLMLIKVIEKLNNMYEKGTLIKKEYLNLKNKYEGKLEESTKNLKLFLKKHNKNKDNLIKRGVNLHSLGAEKKFLKELFIGNEIGEKNFRYILRKIEKQIDRLYSGKNQLRLSGKNDYDIFQKMAIKGYTEKNYPSEIFIRHRAKIIIIKKVLLELDNLAKLNLGFGKDVFEDSISFYNKLYEKASIKYNKIILEYPKTSLKLDIKLAEKAIFTLEESVIEEMFSKGIISNKLYIKFKDDIEENFYEDVTKNLDTFTR